MTLEPRHIDPHLRGVHADSMLDALGPIDAQPASTPDSQPGSHSESHPHLQPEAPDASQLSATRPARGDTDVARTVMLVLTMLTLIAAIGLLLRNVSRTPTSPAANPVGVANPIPDSIAPAIASADTVVAPLNQVDFDPAPPEANDELSAYQAELAEALRPVINVSFTDSLDQPEPWSSHLYGTSDLPASISAPVDETGQQLCMVAQINLADIPALPVSQGNASTLSQLPEKGVLQFWLGLEAPGGTGWTGGPTFADTASNPRQRVTYVAPSDVAQAPATRVPSAARCASSPPAQGSAAALGMKFALGWNAPETTDNRFDSALPQLAGALRSAASEFYRATDAIRRMFGDTPEAQIGGFNRLVNQDPRMVGVEFEESGRDAPITDLYEVLFELHSAGGPDSGYQVGFGNQGSGGWWADPKDVAKLADPSGPNGGRSAVVGSAFWWDGQATPAADPVS